MKRRERKKLTRSNEMQLRYQNGYCGKESQNLVGKSEVVLTKPKRAFKKAHFIPRGSTGKAN